MPKITDDNQENNKKIIPQMPENLKPNGYNWADEVREFFADWCAKPVTARNPLTIKEFSDKYDIPVKTLENWNNTPEFQNTIRAHIRRTELNFAPIVAKSIRDNAIAGSAKHAELHLRHLSMIWNDSNMDINISVSNKSDSVSALEEGRLAEQLGGILEHLRRQETAIDAQYEVVDAEASDKGDKAT